MDAQILVVFLLPLFKVLSEPNEQHVGHFRVHFGEQDLSFYFLEFRIQEVLLLEDVVQVLFTCLDWFFDLTLSLHIKLSAHGV